MISISITDRPLLERFQLAKDTKLMRRFANNIVAYSRGNITKQRSPDGVPWAPRKKGEGRMYLGLRKLICVRDIKTHSAKITLAKGAYGIDAAQLAYAMHHAKGPTAPPVMPDTFWGRLSDEERAEWEKLSSAERLYRWGYKRRTSNGYVMADLSYMERMSDKQLGLLIRKFGLSGSDYQRKKRQFDRRSLLYRLERRPFIGATSQQQQQALKRAIQGLQYGRKK